MFKVFQTNQIEGKNNKQRESFVIALTFNLWKSSQLHKSMSLLYVKLDEYRIMWHTMSPIILQRLSLKTFI